MTDKTAVWSEWEVRERGGMDEWSSRTYMYIIILQTTPH